MTLENILKRFIDKGIPANLKEREHTRITMKIFDAHIHFKTSSSKPYEDLTNELLQNNVYDFLLILNSRKDVELYLKNRERFVSDGFRPRIAIILNVHDSKYLEMFDSIQAIHQEYAVKIHPRISNITALDFEKILECLEKLEYKNIIVDNWYYGPCLKNHIGLELSIFLADNLPKKNIIIAHSGGLKLLETMLYTRPVKNIYYDLALTEIYFNNTSISTDVDHFINYTYDRIMFGSDYPDFGINQSVNALLAHCQNCEIYSKEIYEQIFYKTAQMIYG